MSRKRGQQKHGKKSQPAHAVPEEIRAEGSGPLAEEPAEAAADGTVAVTVTAAAEAAPVDAVRDDDAHPAGDAQLGEAAVLAEVAEVAHIHATAYEAVVDALEAAEAAGAAPAGAAAATADDDDDDGVADADPDADADEELGATLPTSAASMDDVQLKHLVEALVFASDKPVTIQRLRQLTRVADVARLQAALTALAADFAERGLVLQQVSGGYQFRTQTRYSAWVQQLIAGRPVRLSRAQLETLAIIAYRQPITRPEIDDIRGVDSSGTVKVLLDRTLVRVLGKREEVGRPMLYGTTKEFLDFFSLGDLRELPTLREYSELTPESKRVMSDTLGTADDDPPPTQASVIDDVDGEASLDADQAASDALADPVVLAEAVAVARALAADHDDVDTEPGGAAEPDDADAAPPLDPSDDLLAEPDPHNDEILD